MDKIVEVFDLRDAKNYERVLTYAEQHGISSSVVSKLRELSPETEVVDLTLADCLQVLHTVPKDAYITVRHLGQGDVICNVYLLEYSLNTTSRVVFERHILSRDYVLSVGEILAKLTGKSLDTSQVCLCDISYWVSSGRYVALKSVKYDVATNTVVLETGWHEKIPTDLILKLRD